VPAPRALEGAGNRAATPDLRGSGRGHMYGAGRPLDAIPTGGKAIAVSRERGRWSRGDKPTAGVVVARQHLVIYHRHRGRTGHSRRPDRLLPRPRRRVGRVVVSYRTLRPGRGFQRALARRNGGGGSRAGVLACGKA